MSTAILFVLLLGIIINFHELGHFLAAKLFGVYCYEFSFGMGPAIFKKQGKETLFAIRILPIGGYVAMAGEPDGDAAYPDVEVPDDRRLTNKKPWQRCIIMLAGVINNFLLCYLILIGVLLSNGAMSVSPKAVVDQVVAGSPAEQAGFMPGDKITKIVKADGSSCEPETFLDMQSFISDGTEEVYFLLRGEEEVIVKVTPALNEETGTYMIGIQGASGEIVDISLANVWYYAGYEMVQITRVMITTLKGLFFHGAGLQNLSGPVGIYEATDTYATMGFWAYMFLVAQLSLNIGIVNLLPLPVLDGGQTILVLGEWITGKKLNEKVKIGIMIACWVLLIGMMIFVTWNDISKLISG